MGLQVGIQGVRGSFHHQAATTYFGGGITLREYLSFDALVDALLQGEAKVAVMAIENSIAGSILPNYALIDKNKLFITGECFINVHHYLLAQPEQKIEDLKEVLSHPMALLQCKKFLRQYPHLRLVEASDTAEVARRIHRNKIRGVAAIAGKKAAEIYNLQILASEIQTIKNNATRFVLLQTQNHSLPENQINKASLKFVAEHKRGSLATILNVMSDCQLNLTKIQSLPVMDTPWKYAFFVDLSFEQYADYKKAVSLLNIMTEDLSILGEYKKGGL